MLNITITFTWKIELAIYKNAMNLCLFVQFELVGVSFFSSHSLVASIHWSPKYFALFINHQLRDCLFPE